MKVEILYVEGCPHWTAAEERVRDAMRRLHLAEPVRRVKIDSLDKAHRVGFHGSPTILIDGRDPFAGEAAAVVGLSCRLYETEGGLAGTPTVQQLTKVLKRSP